VTALSPELQVMLAPRAAYARLAAAAGPGGAWVLLRRPLAVAALIGAFVSLTTSGSLTLRLWPSATLCWSLVPGVQLLAGAALVGLGRRRPVALSSAIDLFFTAHGPWSLWLLALGARATFALPLGAAAWPGTRPALATAVVPLLWTAVILSGFCRSVLGLGRGRARAATLLYQLAIWSAALAYVHVTTAQGPFAAGPR
jgi:hypothetical protein